MKTNKLFISLLCASVAAVFIAGCSPEAEKVIGPGKEVTVTKRDTTNMLIPEFGIKSADVCQNIGEYNIYFTPTADWTFTSETSWLEIVTPSGAKKDTVLTVKVTQANESKEPRSATTTITVGGVAKTLTITQMGVTPTIKVFSKTVEFSSTVDTGWIYNIFTNCEIEISDKPSWVTNATVITVQKGYEYKVRLELTPDNYDNEDRDENIVLKDKASNYTTDVRILCNRTSDFYKVDTASIAAIPTLIKGGTDAERTFEYKIYEDPELAEYEDPLQFRFYKFDGSRYEEGTTDSPFGVGQKKGTKAGFTASTYSVTLAKYSYDANNSSATATRQIACFMVPESENTSNFEPAKNTPICIVKQQIYYETIKIGYTSKTWVTNGGPQTVDVKFDVREGLTPKVIMDCGIDQRTNLSRVWPGTFVQKGDPVPSTSTGRTEGWLTYTYTVNLDVPENFSLGEQQLGDKWLTVRTWDCYASIYVGEYNSRERVCFNITLKAPPAIQLNLGTEMLDSYGTKTVKVPLDSYIDVILRERSDVPESLEITPDDNTPWVGKLVFDQKIENGKETTYRYKITIDDTQATTMNGKYYKLLLTMPQLPSEDWPYTFETFFRFQK